MSSTAERYDEYWRSADARVYDPRTRQRAEIALALLGERRGRLLDVGCGRGIATASFASAGFSVVGVDASSEAVSEARRRGVDASIRDVSRDPLPGDFDVVVCLEVLEHLLDPLSALRSIVRSAKPDGVLVVSLPNEFHVVSRLSVLVGRPAFAAHDHPHVRLFDRRATLRLFREANLRVFDERSVPLWPPRWPFQGLGRLLASTWRGMFSISTAFLLRSR